MKAKGKLSPDALIRLADRCTVTDGRNFRIDKVKTDDTKGLSASKEEAEALLKDAVDADRGAAGNALRAERVGRVADLPGDGCRREGQRDQARLLRREPSRRAGALVQGAVSRGARPRLPVADGGPVAGTGTDRRVQPVVLRGSAGRPRPSRAAAIAAAAGAGGDQTDLGRATRRHQHLRAPSGAKRLSGSEVLPARVAGGAGAPVLETPRRARETLEVLAGRHPGPGALGRLHEGVRGRRSAIRPRSMPPGSWSRRIESGSPGW